MSTLAEIEAAVKNLSRDEQAELLIFLFGHIGQNPATEKQGHDSFAALSGAFSGPRETTGRNAEEILYARATKEDQCEILTGADGLPFIRRKGGKKITTALVREIEASTL